MYKVMARNHLGTWTHESGISTEAEAEALAERLNSMGTPSTCWVEAE